MKALPNPGSAFCMLSGGYLWLFMWLFTSPIANLLV
jgi:hypothetical protein